MSVLSHLSDTSSKLVLSATEKSSIATSISKLRTRLTDYFGAEVIEQVQFGSSTRGTILPRKADSKSDIDYMIVFDNTNDYRPQTYIDRLKRFAQNKYYSSEIAQSHPTVVLSLNHIKFDLVPAYRDWWSLRIPASNSVFTSENWITTDPNDFNSELSQVNQNNYNLIKPTIRLVKYWNAKNGYIYDSFLLEKDLIATSYWSCYNLKEYFYSAMESLSTRNLASYKADKVDRAKKIVSDTKDYESSNMPTSAELEIKKIIPELYSL